MLADPRVADPTSRIGMSFRLRFRIPPPMFLLLCDYVDEHNMFEYKRGEYECSAPT